MSDVARVQAQSFLKEEHQLRIFNAYKTFTDDPGFATVATLDEVTAQEFSLSIPLYVRRKVNLGDQAEVKSLKQVWSVWEESGQDFWQEMDTLVEMLDGLKE